MNQTYAFIKSLPSQHEAEDFITKKSDARTLISTLPTPPNMKRTFEHIPAAPVTLHLSTTTALPNFISKTVAQSQERDFFQDDTLGGLCLNGRHLPIEIFLHTTHLQNLDPTGALSEEILWHELVHGLEGTQESTSGNFIREKPMSYRLQQAMLLTDRYNQHAPDYTQGSDMMHDFERYMRKGTALQKNVSEIFARIATLYLLHMRENVPIDNPIDLIKGGMDIPDDPFTPEARKPSALTDLFTGLATFSEPAQDLFWRAYPSLVGQAAALYGCDFE